MKPRSKPITIQLFFCKESDVKYTFPFQPKNEDPSEDLRKHISKVIRSFGYEGDLKLTFLDEEGDHVILSDADSCKEAINVALKTKSRDLKIIIENLSELSNKFLPPGAEKELFRSGLPETAFTWMHYLSSKIKSEVKEEISTESKKPHGLHKKKEKWIQITVSDDEKPRQCAGCQKIIAQGPYFVCLEKGCENSIFCMDCVTQKNHDENHVMLKLPEKLIGSRKKIAENAFYVIHSLKRNKKEKSHKSKHVVKGGKKSEENRMQHEREQEAPVAMATVEIIGENNKLIDFENGTRDDRGNPLVPDEFWVTKEDQGELLVEQLEVTEGSDQKILASEKEQAKNDAPSSVINQKNNVEDDMMSQYSCVSSVSSEPNDFELFSSIIDMEKDGNFSDISVKGDEDSYVVASSRHSSRQNTIDDSELEIVPFNVEQLAGQEKAEKKLSNASEFSVDLPSDPNSPISSCVSVNVCENDDNGDKNDPDGSQEAVLDAAPPLPPIPQMANESPSVEQMQKSIALMQFETTPSSVDSTNQQTQVTVDELENNIQTGIDAVTETLEHKSEPSNIKPIYEQEIREEETPSTSRGSFGSSINNNDKFTEFLSKLLLSTSHAFENVSVASSQAFAVVSDAVDALRSASNASPPLPTPRVNKKWEPPKEDNWQPPESKWQPPQAWVPKGTQTLWDDHVEPTLSEDEKYLCSMIQKNRTLKELGFFDEARNTQLLIEKNGDLDEIIEILLSSSNEN